MISYTILKAIHLLGFVLGYGGVLFTALMSARSIKDVSLFKAAAKITPIFSIFIWVGVILLALSGSALEGFWYKHGIDLEKDFVLEIKKAIVLLIVIHGIYVNLYLSRKMKSFAEMENPFTAPGFNKFKILGIISTSTSLILWTSAVILGVWVTAKMLL